MREWTFIYTHAHPTHGDELFHHLAYVTATGYDTATALVYDSAIPGWITKILIVLEGRVLPIWTNGLPVHYFREKTP